MIESTKELTYDSYYMDMAKRSAEMSHCSRRKVGAIIVKDGAIIADGWNGMPAGMDNVCEIDGITRPEVIHAEENAIMKLCRGYVSSVGSKIYITDQPCIHCARMIHNAGITEIYYNRDYHNDDGKDYLVERDLTIYRFYYEYDKDGNGNVYGWSYI